MYNQLLRGERLNAGWSQRVLADRLGTTLNNVSRWELGKNIPGPYFRAKLCTLFHKSAEELGLVEVKPPLPTSQKEILEMQHMSSLAADVPSLWSIPYLRNPHFTGRDELLEQLERHFSLENQRELTSGSQRALAQPLVVKGLGGIGKTQIAVEYAYRAQELRRYTHTFWINAASEEAILTSFVMLAELLPNFSAKNEKDERKLVAEIKRWLEQCHHNWLLIFDNADDAALIQEYLPLRGNGNILLTMRANAVGSFALSFEVEKMSFIEGTHFLLRRAQRFEDASDEEINEAGNIVVTLDLFPLALDQAGAYIEETGCCFSTYLQLYLDHRQALLARRGMQVTHYPDSVATTWSLSFQKVELANPGAAELLRFCAFVAPDHIPEELFKDNAPPWLSQAQETATDLFSFNQMLEDLLKFSLVKRLTNDHSLSIHRLVQAVQIDAMGLGEQRSRAEHMVRTVHAIFPRDPKGEVASWPQCLRYLDQAQACDTLIHHYQLMLPEAAELLDRIGIFLHEYGSYTLAEPLFQRTLQMREQQLGPEHLQVAFTLYNLGLLYYEQGKYALAESLVQRALHIREQQLETDHPLIAILLNALAIIYREQGKYTEAEPLVQRALYIREQQLGPDDPLIATPLNTLASLYSIQGKYAEAEPLYQRALHIREQQLGPEHPKVATSLNGLAALYYKQGKYAEAEPLYQRALHIREQQLGPEHPEVAYPLHNLAELYHSQGKYREVEQMYQRVLRIEELHLGVEHPRLTFSLNNLAKFYTEQGKYTEAESLYQRALHIEELQLGPKHPKVAIILNNLGTLYRLQEKYVNAEHLFRRALTISEQQSSPECPQIAHSLNGMAELYRAQGHYSEAASFYIHALSLQERSLPPHHPDIADTLYGFALLREAQDEPQEALSLYRRALTIREQVFSTQHLTTIDTRNRLRALLLSIGKTEEATQLDIED